jgi:hypothetical protein
LRVDMCLCVSGSGRHAGVKRLLLEFGG